MSVTNKKPRRTAERIADTALSLFNRFGEPNVSMTLLAAELGISPGNLYYHFTAKDALVDTLFDRYQQALDPLLDAASDVGNVEDAWLFFHMLFESIWHYRFLYRDLNDLLSKNRRLEVQFQLIVENKALAVQAVLEGLGRHRSLQIDARQAGPVATAMVVVLTYWLNFAYVRDPRHALEPDHAQAALVGGAFHLLSLLMPYLDAQSRAHLWALAGPYQAQEAGSIALAPATP
jgi:AcrR family transcriptional regulator